MTSHRPSLGARMGASLRGQVPADEVLALLAAAGGVYEDYLAADRLRDELVLADIDSSRTSPAESSQLLCTWVAMASVSLAKALIDAETVDRQRGGFLPPLTAEQALLLLRDVPVWSARGRRAAQEPGYDVAAETRLPVPLPWIPAPVWPTAHVEAVRRAGRAMLEQVAAAVADVERLSRAGSATLIQLRGMSADVQARMQYALGVPAAPGRSRRGAVETALTEGMSACWTLGQVLARPRLAISSVGAAASLPYQPVGPPSAPGGPPPWAASYGPGYAHPDPWHHHHHDHH